MTEYESNKGNGKPIALSRWKFNVNGKTKYLFALDRNQAERKAKKNKWI